VHGHHVGADAVDVGAHLEQQAGEVLYVRLARGVADRRGARRERRGHERVLGRHHRRLVHEDPARLEPPVGRRELDPPVAVHLRAHVRERVEMGVQPPPADEVAARGRHADLPEAGEQRAGEQERSANPRRELLVDARVRQRVGLQAELVLAAPADLDPEPFEQRNLALGVADPGDVREHDLLVGQQARREDREGRVLVPRSHDLPRQRRAALDHELLHRSGG
jgi:hypothetical protein